MKNLIYLLICSFAISSFASEEHPPPFEKIYVCSHDILTTPQGTYYLTCDGKYEPVRCVKRDCEGLYVIKIVHQCPNCGKKTETKTAQEGFSCPLWDIEIWPGIWRSP